MMDFTKYKEEKVKSNPRAFHQSITIHKKILRFSGVCLLIAVIYRGAQWLGWLILQKDDSIVVHNSSGEFLLKWIAGGILGIGIVFIGLTVIGIIGFFFTIIWQWVNPPEKDERECWINNRMTDDR